MTRLTTRPRPGRVEEKEAVEACLLIAERYHGKTGLWAYETFQRLNDGYFGSELPWPHITWVLTPHGMCLGSARCRPVAPVIVLHPSLLRGTEKEEPWGFRKEWLGRRLAADVLLHECIHLAVAYRLGGWEGSGETSHNNDAWVAEVNRLAPLLGLEGVRAARNRVRRVATDGPVTIRGRRPTRVARVNDGNLPFEVVAGFPSAVRIHLGVADAYYRLGRR